MMLSLFSIYVILGGLVLWLGLRVLIEAAIDTNTYDDPVVLFIGIVIFLIIWLPIILYMIIFGTKDV